MAAKRECEMPDEPKRMQCRHPLMENKRFNTVVPYWRVESGFPSAMSFNLLAGYRSASASVPASTSPPAFSFDRPSFLKITRGESATWLYTTLAIVLSLLALEQAVYRYKKAHLPGAKWTIPIIGKFADSLNPTLENYKKQWDAGALSVVSVFNMYDAHS